jgi:hypothetical protein
VRSVPRKTGVTGLTCGNGKTTLREGNLRNRHLKTTFEKVVALRNLRIEFSLRMNFSPIYTTANKKQGTSDTDLEWPREA